MKHYHLSLHMDLTENAKCMILCSFQSMGEDDPANVAGDDSDASEVMPLPGNIKKQFPPVQNTEVSSSSSEHRGDIQVSTARNDSAKRVWDKKQFCVYCKNPYAKIARHLEQVHDKEIDVAKALSYKRGSRQSNYVGATTE